MRAPAEADVVLGLSVPLTTLIRVSRSGIGLAWIALPDSLARIVLPRFSLTRIVLIRIVLTRFAWIARLDGIRIVLAGPSLPAGLIWVVAHFFIFSTWLNQLGANLAVPASSTQRLKHERSPKALAEYSRIAGLIGEEVIAEYEWGLSQPPVRDLEVQHHAGPWPPIGVSQCSPDPRSSGSVRGRAPPYCLAI